MSRPAPFAGYDPDDHPFAERPAWTPRRIAELLKLREVERLSASQCAERLNTTKGAVLGVLHRRRHAGERRAANPKQNQGARA